MDKFREILEIVRTLRGKKGCPWDKAQDRNSIKPYLIEETYEVLDAIQSGDAGRLKEELGDLLLQIIFHAQIAEEEGLFNIEDVLTHICSKLKVRHPHVFGNLKVKDKEEVLRNWEKIKLRERKEDFLSGIPKSLPSLLLARRVQDKLDRYGKELRKGVPFLKERLEDLINVLSCGNREEIEEKLGEVLFLLVELARKKGIDAEDTLRKRVMRYFTLK